MFDHVQIKVDDFEISRAFYEAVLGALGYGVVFEIAGVVTGFGTSVHDTFEVRQAAPKRRSPNPFTSRSARRAKMP